MLLVPQSGPMQMRPARTQAHRASWWSDLGLLGALLFTCYAIAAVGGMSTVDGVQSWYPGLDKPPWTPPNWVFGPVWTVLYTLMAVAAWDAVRRPRAEPGRVWGVTMLQLALNAAWSPLFFYAHWLGVSWVVMTALWLAIVACIAVYGRTSRLAAGLMVPYLAWVSIAWTLNAWVAWYNP